MHRSDVPTPRDAHIAVGQPACGVARPHHPAWRQLVFDAAHELVGIGSVHGPSGSFVTERHGGAHSGGKAAGELIGAADTGCTQPLHDCVDVGARRSCHRPHPATFRADPVPHPGTESAQNAPRDVLDGSCPLVKSG